MVLLCYDKERWYVNLRLYRWKTKLQEVAMKKIILIAVSLIVGYGIIGVIDYWTEVQRYEKIFDGYQLENIEAITMLFNEYEYSLSESETEQFIDLLQKIKVETVTWKHTVPGDGCGSLYEMEVHNTNGETLRLKPETGVPVEGEKKIIIVDGTGYIGDGEPIKQMDEFLSQIETREFIDVNKQVGVSATFPFKELREGKIESIILKSGDREYQLSEEETDAFCEDFWDMAVYEEIADYKSLKDIHGVFAADMLIHKNDNETIKLKLNYKVICINDKSYIIRVAAQRDLYHFIRNCWGNISKT